MPRWSRPIAVMVGALAMSGCAASTPTTATLSSSTSTSAAPASSVTTTSEVPVATTIASVPDRTPVVVNGIYAEPRADLTPGATAAAVTQANIDVTICVSGYTATVRPPTSYTGPLKAQALIAYGYTSLTAADFELDHLVPLEIGGDPTSPANLWPEPWEHRGARVVPEGYGAETKDDLENYLKRAVCAHRMLLADAQSMMATGWIEAARAMGIAAGADATPVAPAPTTTAGGVYYANCAAARAAGAAPILRGQPGYRDALDRDHDGVACE